MMGLQVDPTAPEHATLYNFVVGAIYSLARADQLGYFHQSREPGIGWQRAEESKTLMTRMLVEDRPPERGEWLAGFYFNDAIFRMDVAFEHILRHVANLGPGEEIRVVSNRAEQGGFPPALHEIWSKHAREADNRLKHRSLVFPEDAGISPDAAIAILENLVCALEWALRNPPAGKAN